MAIAPSAEANIERGRCLQQLIVHVIKRRGEGAVISERDTSILPSLLEKVCPFVRRFQTFSF